MVWLLLIAVNTNEYVIRDVFMTKYECEQYVEIEWDMCWPAKLQIAQPPQKNFYIYQKNEK